VLASEMPGVTDPIRILCVVLIRPVGTLHLLVPAIVNNHAAAPAAPPPMATNRNAFRRPPGLTASFFLGASSEGSKIT